MTIRAPLTCGFAVLVATSAACKGDPSGPRALVGACTDTTAVATDLALAPGQATVISGGAQMACVRVPATSAAADYVFVVTDVETKLDVEHGFTVDARALGTGTVAAARVVSADAAAAVPVAGGLDVGARPAPRVSEAAIRAYERARFRGPSSALGQAAQARASRVGGPRGALVAGAIPTVGQTLTFRVPTLDFTKDACAVYDSVSAVVKYVGQASIVAQDVNAPANGFTAADFQNIATDFDQYIYATDTSYFGAPSDIDVNGHVLLLFTPLINKATTRGSGSFFAGYFFSGDLYPRTAATASDACKASNVGELFYLVVPDPAGQFSDPRSATTVRQLTQGTVAHEFQHMINAGIRRPDPAVPFEEVWLDEALSHLAEEVVGRAKRGFGDLQPLSYNDVSAVPADYYSFFNQNLLRFGDWLQRPDTSAGPSVRADVNLSSRGAAWALVRYAADQYSGGNVRGFTRRLVAGPEAGLANLAARSGVPYATMLPDQMLANYADDLGIAGLDQRYTYPSWLMRDAVGRANGGTYPLRVTGLSASGTASTGKLRSGAAAYFRYTPSGASPAMAVRLLDAAGTGAATFAGARIAVLRVK